MRNADLIGNAVPPAWPDTIEDLNHPGTTLALLEIEDEPIAALEINADAAGSQLCDRLLGLPATLREDLVTQFVVGHRSRLAPAGARQTRPMLGWPRETLKEAKADAPGGRRSVYDKSPPKRALVGFSNGTTPRPSQLASNDEFATGPATT